MDEHRIKAIDICAGAGGWACAASNLQIDIVAAVDFWHDACMTYRLNWPNTHVICGDIRDVDVHLQILQLAREHNVKLVLGGVPCEWLSIRRNVGNAPDAAEMADQRATLASVLSIVRDIDPKWWCLEDVKALAKELPEGTPWIEIDAADYSAQRRKRIYVGKFPAPRPSANHHRLSHCVRPGPHRIGPRSFGRKLVTSASFAPDAAYAARTCDKSPTICTITSRHDPEYVVVHDNGRARQLEWQEAASIQGFPQTYLFYGSPSSVGTQIGRAIQVHTGKAILQAICQEHDHG